MEKLMPRINQMGDTLFRDDLYKLFQGIYQRLSYVTMNDPGLAIKAGGGVLVKTGATGTILNMGGILVAIAASTDMPALAGTVVNATFNVFVFSQDSAGTRYTTMGTAAATLAGVKFPNLPDNRVIIGFIVVNPTGTGNFVGGTTALDDVTVVPNVVYVNTEAAFSFYAQLQ
jgi:hypothetical protein